MTPDAPTPPTRPALDYLVVALDMPSSRDAIEMATRLHGTVRWVKVGLELYVAAGPSIVSDLRRLGFEVFLDLKFHDIPNTVAGASAAAARTGAGIVNVHAGGGIDMMKAALLGAARGAKEGGTAPPKILAVTVLTSLTGLELPGYYQSRPMGERVVYLAESTREAGLDGVVCSPKEIEILRAVVGPGFLLLTPGLRFADGDPDDQKRVATPHDAARAGSDYLVMGRPSTGAADPTAAAARAILSIQGGLAARATSEKNPY